VLYAHFEELESEKAKMREEISEDEDGWAWGWYGAREMKDEVCGSASSDKRILTLGSGTPRRTAEMTVTSFKIGTRTRIHHFPNDYLPAIRFVIT
jgi:hypothetical protein